MISEKVEVRFFQKAGNDTLITFNALIKLVDFNGIIGDDTLKVLEPVSDRKQNLLMLSPNIRIPLFKKFLNGFT